MFLLLPNSFGDSDECAATMRGHFHSQDLENPRTRVQDATWKPMQLTTQAAEASDRYDVPDLCRPNKFAASLRGARAACSWATYPELLPGPSSRRGLHACASRGLPLVRPENRCDDGKPSV